MSDGNATTPARKKRHALKWLAGAIMLLLLLFLYRLVGPNPAVIISRQTTHITEPLSSDGLPDYETHLLELYREGVRHEENAGVLLTRALWPAELDPADRAAVISELGMATMPSEEDALAPLNGAANQTRMLAWLDTERGEQSDAASNDDDGELTPRIEAILNRATSQPWTSDQVPPLAQWVAENKKPLDWIVEGSSRPRYYVSSPTLLDKNHDPLLRVLLPHVDAIQEVGRSLPTRAMWHLGEGRPMDSWQDILALHRIARLVAQGHTLVEQTVAIGLADRAFESTVTLLDDASLTVEQARQFQQDLVSLPPFAAMTRALYGDRLMFLDAIVHEAGDRRNRGHSTSEFKRRAGLLSVVSIDWNVALRMGNRWYDRYVEASRLSSYAARAKAFDQIETDARRLELMKDRRHWSTILFSRQSRSEVVASIYVSLMLPAGATLNEAEARTNNMLELLRLAAALARYRAEYRAYPEMLDALIPSSLSRLPVDLYNAKPFAYKRTTDGYLLYSVGENGRDDGGANVQYPGLNRQQLDGLDEIEANKLRTQIHKDADDVSILVPRPAFELPKMQPIPQ
jgi:hypothetical protein